MPIPINRLDAYYLQVRRPCFPIVWEDALDRMLFKIEGIEYTRKEIAPDHVVCSLCLQDDFRPKMEYDYPIHDTFVFEKELVSLPSLFLFAKQCKNWNNGSYYAASRPRIQLSCAAISILSIREKHVRALASYTFRSLRRLFFKKTLYWNLAIERAAFDRFLGNIEGVRHVV